MEEGSFNFGEYDCKGFWEENESKEKPFFFQFSHVEMTLRKILNFGIEREDICSHTGFVYGFFSLEKGNYIPTSCYSYLKPAKNSY